MLGFSDLLSWEVTRCPRQGHLEPATKNSEDYGGQSLNLHLTSHHKRSYHQTSIHQMSYYVMSICPCDTIHSHGSKNYSASGQQLIGGIFAGKMSSLFNYTRKLNASKRVKNKDTHNCSFDVVEWRT